MIYRERYTPYPMGANATQPLPWATNLGAFIATTAGTITITDDTGLVILNAHPVAAGQYLPLPILVGRSGDPGVTVVLGGGASGCLLV